MRNGLLVQAPNKGCCRLFFLLCCVAWHHPMHSFPILNGRTIGGEWKIRHHRHTVTSSSFIRNKISRNTKCNIISVLYNTVTSKEIGENEITKSTEITTTDKSHFCQTEICSSPMQVYIEDTDAYGVMYNSNYLRAYDRALHMTSFSKISNTEKKKKGNILQHDGWSIVSLDEMKFKSSPPLGGSYIIQGILRASDVSGCSEMWDMQMIKLPDDVNDDNKNDNENNNQRVITNTVYNTARGIRIARSSQDKNLNSYSTVSLPPLKQLSFDEKSLASAKRRIDIFQTYRDEYDPHLISHVPLRNILNIFERTRSRTLGGPDQLRRLQQEDNIIFVVTSVNNLQLINYYSNNDDNDNETSDDQTDHSLPNFIKPGQTIITETDIMIKRRGMIIEFYHKLKIPNDDDGDTTFDSNGKLYAQGIVTLMALDGKTRKPTSKLPSWLFELLES